MLELTLSRPEARNAINSEMTAALEAAIDRLENDESLWIGLIGAAGTVFSAGADLKELTTVGPDGLSTERGGFAGLTRRARAKPLIAVVEAPALAGGCEIVLSCDLVVASTRAEFGLPEVKRSLLASGGGLFRLGRAIPLNIAMQLALTGEPIGAARAHELGLVNELTEPGMARTVALRLAAAICANSPLSVRASRDVMLRSLGRADDEAWQISDEAVRRLSSSADFAEGAKAFLEKRAPVWTDGS